MNSLLRMTVYDFSVLTILLSPTVDTSILCLGGPRKRFVKERGVW